MRRNIILFVIVLIASYFTAPYFGALYDKFYPQHGDWIVSRNDSIFFAGFLLSYMVLIPFIFELFGTGNNKKWIMWSLFPVVLFLLFADSSNIYLPIILGVIAFLLAKLINAIVKKLHPNSPMVLK